MLTNFLVLAFLCHYSFTFYSLLYFIIFLKASMTVKLFYTCIRFFLLNNDNLIVYRLEKSNKREENVKRNKWTQERLSECRGSNACMVFYPLGLKEKLIIFSWNAHFKHMWIVTKFYLLPLTPLGSFWR